MTATGLTLDYRWSEGSVPPPGHYRIRIKIDEDGARVSLSPGYPGADTPTWTVPLDLGPADREALVAALATAGLFDADWQPRHPRRIGGSGWRLDVTVGGRSASLPRDAIAEGHDPKVIEAAVRAVVPEATWADLRARRRAFVVARR